MTAKSTETKKTMKKTAKAAMKSPPSAARKRSVAKSGAAPQAPAIPQKQWELPASYSADGMQLATLRDVIDPNVPTLSLAELSPEQRAELVASRIAAQPDYEIAMLGAGIVNKERAIEEVKAQSKIGRALTEIEQRVINHLVDRATKTNKPQ